MTSALKTSGEAPNQGLAATGSDRKVEKVPATGPTISRSVDDRIFIDFLGINVLD